MVNIRPITADDVEAVAEIESNVFTLPWQRDDFADLVAKDDRGYMVIDYLGKVIGGCAYRNVCGDVYITNVEIDEAYRGRGYSKELIRKVIETGRSIGGREFTLEVRASNEIAIKLYESFGFVSEGIRREFYDFPKEDALIMWLRE